MAKKELSDDDLLGGNDSNWDEHSPNSEDEGQEFDVGKEDPQDEVNDGLDDDDGKPLIKPGKKDEEDPDAAEDPPEENNEEDPEADPEEDPDAEPEADPEELTPWEKKNYSAAMQKRVTRERVLKREAEEKFENESVQRQAAEKDAYDHKKVILNLLAKEADRDITDETAKLKAAKEAGETDDEIAAQGKLDELRAKRRDIESAATGLKEPVKVERQVLPPATKRWMDRNRWFADTKFSAEAHYARSIDVALNQEGKLAMGTAEYFAELDKRIHQNIPALRNKIKKTFGGGAPTQRVAPVNRAAPARPAGGNSASNKVTLTAQEVAFAKSLGLTSKSDLKAYAVSKMNREREERNSKER